MSKKSIREQVKEAHPEFYEETQSLTVEQIDQRLAELAKNAESVLDAKAADEALAQAREEAAQLAAPYSEGMKLIRLKSKYLVSLSKDEQA